MGLLGKLFGPRNQPYVDAGMALTFKLCRSLSLPGWKEGLPDYTQEEIAAIDRSLSQFQKIADDEVSGEARFHPELLPDLQRMFAGKALEDLASSQWANSDEVPENWKAIASTYLKAWAARLEPLTLMGLSDLLAKVGCKDEAKETVKVILLVPTYAEKLWGKNKDELFGIVLAQAKEALRTI